MFDRPRCREWTPLATQQLRLRNLIKITGHNIIPSPSNHENTKCQFYYSLHYNINDKAFYISEKLDSHGNGNFDWNEINCKIILKSIAKSVCIKIWQHYPTLNSNQLNNSKKLLNTDKKLIISLCESYNDKNTTSSSLSSSSSKLLLNNENISNDNNDDKLLFQWGVNLSGLILLTKLSDIKFIENSLLFQMNGGYFVSAYSLTQDTMRQQLSFIYQLDCIENEYNDDYDKNSVAKSCDIINSNNNNKLSTLNEIESINNDYSINYNHINREFQINSPRNSRSCSPVRDHKNNKLILDNDKKFVTTITNDPITNSDLLTYDLLNMLKIRYVEKKFRKTEIRNCYNLDKLLKFQEKQRKLMLIYDDTKELTEKISMLSPFCLNLELISNKGIYYRPKGNPSMGKTLNRLLFQQIHIKPEDIIKSQHLKCQIETGKFRLKLLIEERNRFKLNYQKLEKKLNDLQDNNIELESWLMSRYRNLSREKEFLLNQKLELIERRENLLKNQIALRQIKSQLCNEIKQIYPIENKYADKYVISYIHLPNADALTMVTNDSLLDVTPLSLSSALGYVAHVLKMCSIVLNLPLRNPIKHEGSRSRILDVVKEIPNGFREFPLYSRTFPPPKPVIYAVYLLNQNIAQLNAITYGIKHCDLRTTLSNLLLLLNGPIESNLLLEPNNLSQLKNLLEETSVSNSSVDLNVIPIPKICNKNISKPVDVVDGKICEQRISRSVGSYSYDRLSSNKDFYNSEPILTTQNVHLTSFSDSENI